MVGIFFQEHGKSTIQDVPIVHSVGLDSTANSGTCLEENDVLPLLLLVSIFVLVVGVAISAAVLIFANCDGSC